ncbi:monosaccharide ABC transporter ATP-binding protein, CUT2 family (TC 3.A.1.2.-) [Pseudoxanthobacter soli DSM 19599]|uniref:Monosaccharide ABC transporter ATP-binding protein, CUT2 family (TC 3.A.1.2.-) n=1 Tax=Pseudoxanthobacter soli DSM 19599 TaxID=1123029 RepID=A0A1M7ZRB8_9HYPH|nr:sugar ABC transporter ATP-binding protein [Pseudoxanthobacter soli]SHO67417.1 monosaccharide ABC transporter ATP-binding protein, CUT2 family (TC 3.A.1.2.-) [Pseudoxanthobacter soli DSM 19599]
MADLSSPSTVPVLEAREVSKFFPGVKALQDVSMRLEPGSIHALLGENGAGKSTLIKIITGVHRPDGGTLLLDGTPIELRGTRDATSRGIGVVHQERNLIPRFTVGENISLERLATHPLKTVDYQALNETARHWLGVLGLDIDPRTPVSQLSVAKMQLVEIAKALSLKSRVLLLDEPTASLTPHETVALFDLLRRLRDDGVSMLFVSHKLEEVQEICDRVTVLRDGRNACASQSMAGMGRHDLVRLMIGRSEQIANWPTRHFEKAPEALKLTGVSTALGHRDVDLTVRKGEIVGLYGLVGAGRTELAKCIMGAHPVTGGTVEVAGKPAKITTVADAIHRYRIGYVSEDRKQEGLVLIHTVLENAGITVWRRLANRLGLLTDGTVRRTVEPYIRKLEVRTPSLEQIVGNLSGGNQQKISVAKWLAAGIDVLIVDEPSVGIDIKTKAYLHELLRELSDSGTAILLITSDMPEMITLADRIVVMNDYRISGELENTRDYGRMSEGIMYLIHRVEAAE